MEMAVFKMKIFIINLCYYISGNQARFIPKDTALGISLAAAIIKEDFCSSLQG